MLSITDVYLSPHKQWPPRRQVPQRIHPLFVTISQPPSLASFPYSPERSLAENYLLAAVSRHPTSSPAGRGWHSEPGTARYRFHKVRIFGGDPARR